MLKHWQRLMSMGLVLVAVVSTGRALALDAGALDWGAMNDEIQDEVKHLEGEWKDAREWRGTLCNGRYSYRTNIKGDVTKVDLNLNEQGFVDAHAEIENIHAGAEGSYRSDLTLCVPFGGWVGIGADSAVVDARATFGSGEQGLKDIKLRVISTKLGTLHFGRAVPPAVERFLTAQVNRALEEVWKGRLGTWLSDKISEFIRKKVPENRK